jgi:manganese/zinc/iron transport system substrate-binding protein
MGPGVDPHAYKATRKDLEYIANANIVFFNGLHLEGKMADILEKNSQKKNFHAVSNAIDDIKLLRDKNFDIAGIDPHIWFDVSLWRDCVAYICSVIKQLDPENADFYEKNTQSYTLQLEELHEFIRAILQTIPRLQRILISAHDAFNYFGRAYDIDVYGLQGISTVSECGLKDVSDLITLIMGRSVKAIFLETSVPEGPIRAVLEGCIQRGCDIKIGGHLFSDALGSSDTQEGTYIGMMRANVETIVKSLQ